MCGREIEKSICREMSGNLESGMVAVGMFLWTFFVFSKPSFSKNMLNFEDYVEVIRQMFVFERKISRRCKHAAV